MIFPSAILTSSLSLYCPHVQPIVICCMSYKHLLVLGDQHQAKGTSADIPEEEDCIPSEHCTENFDCLKDKEVLTNEIDYIFFGSSGEEENERDIDMWLS